jgi:hypothetical protein
MHAVQSALAVRRERVRRQSLRNNNKGQNGHGRKASTNSAGIPSDFRSSERSNGSFNYTTVGAAFIIFGSLMMVPIFAGGAESLGLDWHHLLGVGGLLIVLGIIMVVVEQVNSNKVERTMDKYVAKMGRSASKDPIIEDVEYGVDSRRSSVTTDTDMQNNQQQQHRPIPKHFEHDGGSGFKKVVAGVAKV